MVLRSIKDRLKKLNVAVAEVDHQDLWQRSSFEIVGIGNTQIGVQQLLETALESIERRNPGLIINKEFQWLT